MLNIVVSVLVLYLQSLSHLSDSVALHSIELSCTLVFTCEVLLRVVAAYHPAALLFDVMVWVDIASVVPFCMLPFSHMYMLPFSHAAILHAAILPFYMYM